MKSVLAALAIWLTASPAMAQTDPAASIRAIYQAYIASENKLKSPDLYNPRYYSARINQQIAGLKRACAKKQMCMPDADFLVDGQDYQIRALKVDTISQDTSKATVTASFTNMGDLRRMRFSMVLENGRWVIDQMQASSKEHPKGYTLTEILKPNP